MKTIEIVNDYVKKAKAAQAVVADYTQEQIDAVVLAVAKVGYKTAEEMARMAYEETGMGSVAGKLAKNLKTPQTMWYFLRDKKSVGVVEEDPINQIVKIAKPAGIVACVTPSTNPTVTPIGNGMQILKGRNAVIFCAHPKSKKSTCKMVSLMREAVAELGCPKDIIQAIEEPSIEITQMLMAACDVNVATGGPGMVKAAYSSGKPSLGVGQGNVQMILGDDYEDLDGFAEDSVTCRAWDNGLGCTSDQMVHVPKARFDDVVAAFKRHGAYYIDKQETIDHLRNMLFTPEGIIDRSCVGNTAKELAAKLGIDVDDSIRTLLLPINAIAHEDLFCKEILCPVERIRTYTDFYEAIEAARSNYLMEGAGHVCSLYTRNEAYIAYAGDRIPVCRLMICQSAGAGAGRWNNGFPATNTLGCGFWGGNSISENFHYKHVLQYTHISRIIDNVHIPTPEELFGEI